MKLYEDGQEREAHLQGDGFVWELWKDEGHSLRFTLKKRFPDDNTSTIEDGFIESNRAVGIDYDNFLTDLVKKHTEKK